MLMLLWIDPEQAAFAVKVLSCLVLAYVCVLVVGPLLVYATVTVPQQYKLEPLDAEAFFKEQDEEFLALDAAVLGRGFGFVTTARLPSKTAPISFCLYRHEGLKALATVTLAKLPGRTLRFVEFVHSYQDRSCLNVSNSTMVSIYPKRPDKLVFRFPRTQEVSQVLANFETIHSNLTGQKTPTLPEPGTELQKITEHMNQEAGQLVRMGYYSAYPNDGQRKMTLKGAFVFSWKSLWPIKSMLNAVQIKAAQRALAAGSRRGLAVRPVGGSGVSGGSRGATVSQ